MKLKTQEIEGNTYAVVQDGKPVYVADDGKETPFDAPYTVNTISRVNSEAKAHREAKEALEARLKPFEGIEDAEAARKAMETVRNLDDKKLVDAGDVERVKTEAIEATKQQFAPMVETLTKERDEIRAQLVSEKIGGAFSRSQFVSDALTIPADIVEATFGRNFQLNENGQVVAKDRNGSEIYSKERPGELAGFDEALKLLVDEYPHKDSILKGAQATGSEAAPNGTRQKGRVDLRSLSDHTPAARQAAIGNKFPELPAA